MERRARTGAYPGTFNPLTRAHLQIAAAARTQHRLDRMDLVLSRRPLGKDEPVGPRFEDRVEVVRTEAARHDWLEVVVTDLRLVAEIARGYDVVVMGADKWAQVNDPDWYADIEARDEALASLPTVAVAPRGGNAVPAGLLLDVPAELDEISSTGVRDGAHHHMAPAAARFDATTGAWSDPDRYRRWLESR